MELALQRRALLPNRSVVVRPRRWVLDRVRTDRVREVREQECRCRRRNLTNPLFSRWTVT